MTCFSSLLTDLYAEANTRIHRIGGNSRPLVIGFNKLVDGRMFRVYRNSLLPRKLYGLRMLIHT